MTKIALLGAGGKMAVRLGTNLKGSRFDVDHVEVSEEGRRRVKSTVGVDCVDLDRALGQADVIVMAVPDRLIGKIAHGQKPLAGARIDASGLRQSNTATFRPSLRAIILRLTPR